MIQMATLNAMDLRTKNLQGTNGILMRIGLTPKVIVWLTLA